MNVRGWTSTVTAVVATMSVAACSGPGPGTGAAAPDVDPSWATHTVGPVVVRIPEGWEELAPAAEGADGATYATFGVPDDGSMVRPGISVSLLSERTQDAEDEATAFVYGERATRGVEDLQKVEVERSDAELAISVSLWNEHRTAEGPAEVTSRWIIADLKGGQQVTVGVLGPRDEFAELPLDEVLDAVTFESEVS
jgi:hypothetical protein